jgi:hypothetical protein
MTVWVLVLCAVLLLAAVLALQTGGRVGKKDRAGTYKAGRLMTENERAFFARLVVALPDHYIFPQVAMGALIVPASTNKSIAHADRLRVAQQRVDFVVCDRACNVTVVIELDDRTHQAGKDQRRDERLNQAAIRTVRFQSKNKPDVQAIREAVLGPASVRGAGPARVFAKTASGSVPAN